MPYRIRGRGHFTAPSSRSGRGYVYDGRAVSINGENFQINWLGPVVVKNIIDSLNNTLNQLSDEALAHMQAIVPYDTGQLHDSCFASIIVDGDRINLVVGAGMPYAVYVELGTSSTIAQPYIRPTFDFIIAALPALLKNEVASRAGMRAG